MPIALTREVSRSIARCRLTHVARVPIDVERAREQHRAYEIALREAGCRVERLPEAPELPDAVFVEDAAVAFDRLAVIARPGAPSRRPEVDAIATRLGAVLPLVRLRAPATLDGGDVLAVDDTVFVGRSTRTNAEGIRQLAAAVAPLGIRVVPVAVGGVLHLKSAVTRIAPDTLLWRPGAVDPRPFRRFDVVEVDPAEPGAANALRVGDVVIFPQEFPRTRARIESRGIRVLAVPASELAKAEGGVTCCSLLLP